MSSNSTKQAQYTQKLNQLRQQVNQSELNFNEVKRKFKYEIQLDQERTLLENLTRPDASADDIQLTEFLKSGRGEQNQMLTETGGTKPLWSGGRNRRGSSTKIKKEDKTFRITEKDLQDMDEHELRK